MEIFGNKKVAKVADFHFCKLCDYKCSRRSNFEKHLSTQKHKNRDLETFGNEKVAKVAENEKIYNCVFCNRTFKTNSGLWKHKNTQHNESTNVSEEVVIKLIEQNKELQKQLTEQVKKQNDIISDISPNIVNVTNNNITNHQKFNINIFLNEDCKDAINMSDFIKSIKVSLEQLNITNSKGLVQGISNTIVENMKKLSLHERPMHCTDIKREILYIKDNDIWEKDKDKNFIKKAIKKTSGKNYEALSEWTKENQDFMENDNKQHFYAKTLSEIGKLTDNVDSKVIKNLCKETYLK